MSRQEFSTLVGQTDEVKSWNRDMINACQRGHIDIVKLMIDKGANDWNYGLINACYGGYIDIVKLMIDKGANDWNCGMINACFMGHTQIVKLMIGCGANDWNDGLNQACFRGCIELVDLMIEHGADINEVYTDIPNSSIERLVKHGIILSQYTGIVDKYRYKLSCIELILSNQMCKDLAQVCSIY